MERIISGRKLKKRVCRSFGGVWQRMKSHRSSIIKTETVLGPLEKREGRK